MPTERDEEPQPPYPQGYLRGLQLFCDGEFWECHEALEEIWLTLDGGPKLFYQGIIQGAAAFHHVDHTGKWHAARRLFDLAREKLALYAPRYMGLDIADLIARLDRARAVVDAIDRGEAEEVTFDESLYFELWPDDAGVARPLAD